MTALTSTPALSLAPTPQSYPDLSPQPGLAEIRHRESKGVERALFVCLIALFGCFIGYFLNYATKDELWTLDSTTVDGSQAHTAEPNPNSTPTPTPTPNRIRIRNPNPSPNGSQAYSAGGGEVVARTKERGIVASILTAFTYRLATPNPTP